LTSFVFNENNRKTIHKSIYLLSEKGLDANHLMSVPVDIFHYYCDLYNTNAEAEALDKATRNSSTDKKQANPVGTSFSNG